MRVADLLGLLLTLARTRITGLVGSVVRAAGGAAQPCRPDRGRVRARCERKRQQGHYGRGQQHFPGTHRYLLLVDGRLAVLVRDPHGPDRPAPPRAPPPPVVVPAAYLSASGRQPAVLWAFSSGTKARHPGEGRGEGRSARRGFHAPAGLGAAR